MARQNKKNNTAIGKIAKQETAEAMFDKVMLGYNKQKKDDEGLSTERQNTKDYKAIDNSLSDTVRNLKDMNGSLSSINDSLKNMTDILNKALLTQKQKAYAEEEAALEARPEDKPKLAGDGETSDGKGFGELIKDFFTNPAIIAAFSGLVYMFLPKDIKEKISSFFSGFSKGIEGTNEPMSTFQIALASAAAGLTTYLGASVLKSISEAVTTTLSLITKAKTSFGKLKGKGIKDTLKSAGQSVVQNKALVAGVAAGGATAAGLTISGAGASTGASSSGGEGAGSTTLPDTKPPISGSGGGSAPGSADDPMNADLGQYVIKKDPGVDLEGLHPNLKKRLAGMAKEYHEKTGKKIQINSAYRDSKKQQELFLKIGAPKAAPPGRSKHEFGAAFDMNSGDAENAIKLGLFEKYGFTRPVKGETWHVEPVENRGGSFPDNPVTPGAPVVVASAKGAVVPGSGEKLPQSILKPPPTATSSTSETGGAKDILAGLFSAAKDAQSQAVNVTSEDIAEAEKINKASGDPEGITAEQVASNRALNKSLTAGAGAVFGFDPKDVVMTDKGAEVLSKSESIESAMSEGPQIVNNTFGGTEFVGGKPSVEPPLDIPSPMADRGTLGLGVKHSSAYYAAVA
jgi:hypothetical protein